MAKQWAKDAAKKELPDVEIVEKAPKSAGAKTGADSGKAERPSRPGASVSELRRKYLGVDAAGGEDSVADADDDDEVEVMQVRNKKTAGADPADDPGARALIVSKKKGTLGSAG